MPGLPFTCERRDGSTAEQWDAPTRTYRRFECGALVEERPFTPAEDAWALTRTVEDTRRANRDQLGARVRTALANNAAYLDKVQAGTATNADHIAQVPALTRQMQGVIRLLVGSDLLDQIGG
ncbi:hypothetical protein PV413_03650 [Streptomyces scabiei]|uniref:hypothetical protein n=1 Tax=Streptomyces scabiei TaxID=1930 RepID=UPI0005A0D4CE|nr:MULTISPECIES: hypothetical protein [Streptomyces]MBP5875647.1 hypothetical protein [Streptomyces sp. LBUM 1477]MDX2725872.1 hypothetical protein [Streptomyces scabiei]MDX2749662.1 hypothetical protein [Streptomyces scabiei]MDX2897372.1 hypothetical protein [Streptomyces scabiei]MDX3033350.1 hypothetical protein [Streptomyces scabiei]